MLGAHFRSPRCTLTSSEKYILVTTAWVSGKCFVGMGNQGRGSVSHLNHRSGEWRLQAWDRGIVCYLESFNGSIPTPRICRSIGKDTGFLQSNSRGLCSSYSDPRDQMFLVYVLIMQKSEVQMVKSFCYITLLCSGTGGIKPHGW
jgi:hypothetical protein